MLKPKIYYFFIYGAGAALVPYLVIYYQGLGLSGSQIGLLAGIPTLMSMLSTPVWGGLADATNKKRLLLGIAILVSMSMVGVLSLTTTFLWMVLVVTLYAFHSAPIIPMMDSTVMELLGEHKDQYGKLRLWGAVGWGLSAPLIGWMNQHYGLQWSFWGYMIQMAVVFMVVMGMPVGQASLANRFWQGLRNLLQDMRWRLFLLVVFVSGVGSSVLSNYLFLRLNDLGATKTLMGVALAVATLSELPVFFYSGILIKRWGARSLLLLSLFVYVFRDLLISFLPVAWMVLPVQLLHGLTFSITWAAGVSYARQIAPAGLGATAQGLFSSTFFGLGGAVGAFMGGILYQTVGSALLFRYIAVLVLAAALFFLWAGRSSRFAVSSSG